MLRVEQVAHEYPGPNGSITALAPVSFVARLGSFTAIVGPSGCGKTTLLHILAGLVQPTQGQIWLDNVPITGPDRRVGLVFQQANLMPWRSVIDNVALPLELAGVARAERTERAEQSLTRLGLAEFRDAYPAELSGGMAQRVAIGRALIYDPDVLLLDEPFGALDAMTREQMQLQLMELWSAAKKLAIMVTHSITEAVFVADTVLVMSPRPGRIRAEVTIPLPRPRRLEMIHSPEVGALAAQVRAYIDESRASSPMSPV